MGNILVTGGAGFIGSNLVDFLISKNYNVKILDNLTTGNKDNINENAEFIEGNIKDYDIVSKAMENIDYVFHLAALVSVPLSIENPELNEETNVIGTQNVFEAALKNNVKKLICASSAAIYGDNKNIPLIETQTPKPMSPYAQAKLYMEKLGKEYSKKGLKTICLRYFNVYGKRQDPKNPYSGVISIFIDKALNNKNIIIYGDGNQTRDFIFIEDILDANLLALNELIPDNYNVATNKSISVKKLAEFIINITGSKSKIIHKEKRTGDIIESCADIDKIKKYGFEPKYDIEQGLKKLIKG